MRFIDCLRGKGAAAVAAISGLAFAGSSMAAIDVTSVTTALTDAGTAVATVGAAVLVVIVGVAAYKYIRPNSTQRQDAYYSESQPAP